MDTITVIVCPQCGSENDVSTVDQVETTECTTCGHLLEVIYT